MKKYLIALISAALLASTVGCANGPLRQWWRGAPCNTCNPQIQQPLNVAPACNTGCAENTVGTGILSRWFRGHTTQHAGCQTGSCGTGNCPTLAADPIPGGEFVNGVQSNNLPLMMDSQPAPAPATELYGNTSNSVGRLELPPISFGDN